MMRSPPPPVSQQAGQPPVNSYGNPYQSPPAGGASGSGGGGFGQGFNFINDPTAQMGFQVGQTAMKAGQEYMEQNVSSIQTPTFLSARKTMAWLTRFVT